MTHKEILEQTKSELDRIVSVSPRKLYELDNPKLEVGKWYKFDTPLFEYLLKYDGSDTAYGFADGTWSSSWSFSKDVNQELAKGKEATPKEVEEALVKEAKSRYKVGDKISILDSCNFGNLDDYKNRWVIRDVHDPIYNGSLFYGNLLIFDNGNWATVIEQGKFAELKEAYRNGAAIQYKHKGLPNWIDNPNPAWSDNYDYRIKPEEKQTLADDIQYLKDKHPNLRFTITVEDNV